MVIVRQLAFTFEELVLSIKCPPDVKVMKARRLNKKRVVEELTTWKRPAITVV